MPTSTSPANFSTDLMPNEYFCNKRVSIRRRTTYQRSTTQPFDAAARGLCPGLVVLTPHGNLHVIFLHSLPAGQSEFYHGLKGPEGFRVNEGKK